MNDGKHALTDVIFSEKHISLYEKTILKRRVIMNDLDHLRTVITRVEDTMLTSKDPHYVETLQLKLRRLRVELQQKEWSQRERESAKW